MRKTRPTLTAIKKRSRANIYVHYSKIGLLRLCAGGKTRIQTGRTSYGAGWVAGVFHSNTPGGLANRDASLPGALLGF